MGNHIYTSKRDSLEQIVLCTIIRRLWWRERRLGHYTPTKELCLDLAQLPTNELIILRRRVMRRLRRWLCDVTNHASSHRVAA